ncbi:MAG: DUF2804 domain-containing protein [Anaerolineaceae bacterium]
MTTNTPYHLKPGDHILDPKGRPLPGYALNGSGIYDRKRVHAAPWRLKEWDFYQVTDHNLCLQLTIGHVSYAGNCNIMLFDHAAKNHLYTKDLLIALPFNSLHMPASAHADSTLTIDRNGALLRFETSADVHHLTAKTDRLSAEVTLRPTIRDTITICTPFDKPNEFYFNEKINLLEAEIALTLDGQAYTFDPASTFGLMDWGRGVWPFAHEWLWSSLSARLNGRLFGFNLGCGFGNVQKAHGSENVVYYGDETIKLNQMRITHQPDFMQPWQFAADDGRFEAVLTPHYDRTTHTKMLFVDNTCHQMFGRFEGFFIGNDGQRVDFGDVVGFAEHAYNHW